MKGNWVFVLFTCAIRQKIHTNYALQMCHYKSCGVGPNWHNILSTNEWFVYKNANKEQSRLDLPNPAGGNPSSPHLELRISLDQTVSYSGMASPPPHCCLSCWEDTGLSPWASTYLLSSFVCNHGTCQGATYTGCGDVGKRYASGNQYYRY